MRRSFCRLSPRFSFSCVARILVLSYFSRKEMYNDNISSTTSASRELALHRCIANRWFGWRLPQGKYSARKKETLPHTGDLRSVSKGHQDREIYPSRVRTTVFGVFPRTKQEVFTCRLQQTILSCIIKNCRHLCVIQNKILIEEASLSLCKA